MDQVKKTLKGIAPHGKSQPKTPSNSSGSVGLEGTNREGVGLLSDKSQPIRISDSRNSTVTDNKPWKLVHKPSHQAPADLKMTPQTPFEQPSHHHPLEPTPTPTPSPLTNGTLSKEAAESLDSNDRVKMVHLPSKYEREATDRPEDDSSPPDGGDAAVKFRTSDYVVLCWAVLRLCLQVITNHEEVLNRILSSMEFATEFETRCAEYKKLLGGHPQPNEQFDHRLEEVSNAISLYMIAAAKYLRGSSSLEYSLRLIPLRILGRYLPQGNFYMLEKHKTILPELSSRIQDGLRSRAFLETVETGNRSEYIDPAAEGISEWLLEYETYQRCAFSDQGLLGARPLFSQSSSTVAATASKGPSSPCSSRSSMSS